MTTSIYGCCHWLDGSTRSAGRLPRIRAAFRDLNIPLMLMGVNLKVMRHTP